MIKVSIVNGKAVLDPNGPVCRWDWRTLADAEQIAAQLTETEGRLFIATDSGPYVAPRYDVIDAPAIGDKVSRAFNGDYYPAGKITKISKSLRRVETDEGIVFYRKKQSGAWVNGKYWGMVNGHRSEWNPHF